jgi:hypothetical protein
LRSISFFCPARLKNLCCVGALALNLSGGGQALGAAATADRQLTPGRGLSLLGLGGPTGVAGHPEQGGPSEPIQACGEGQFLFPVSYSLLYNGL